jgi:hypothetical protein
MESLKRSSNPHCARMLFNVNDHCAVKKTRYPLLHKQLDVVKEKEN